jgi:RNA polymerase sigma factor (sigma-70 family)
LILGEFYHLYNVNEEERKRYDRVFEKELLPHIDALSTFAFHLTLNEDDADDLVQETYLKAYRFIDKYLEGTNAKAWLFKILKNAYINEYRRKSKAPAHVDYEDIIGYQDSEESAIGEYTDLREELFNTVMGDEVTNAINSLPVDFRTVILLGTVRSRLFRARNVLKDKLKAYAEAMGFSDKRKPRPRKLEE